MAHQRLFRRCQRRCALKFAPELVDTTGCACSIVTVNSFGVEEYWIAKRDKRTHFGMNDAYTWVLRVESRAQRPAQRDAATLPSLMTTNRTLRPPSMT